MLLQREATWALSTSQQSKFTDALREYEEALRIEMATLGKNYPEVATTRNNMGIVYLKQSKFADALREHRMLYIKDS